jgi:hypothetical protein
MVHAGGKKNPFNGVRRCFESKISVMFGEKLELECHLI